MNLIDKYEKSNRTINTIACIVITLMVLLKLMGHSGGEGGMVVGGIIFGFILLPCNLLILIFTMRSLYLRFDINKGSSERVALMPAMNGILLIGIQAIIVFINRLIR